MPRTRCVYSASTIPVSYTHLQCLEFGFGDMQVLAGRDPHHIAEAEFKALARALRFAVEPDPRVDGIPSTKGAL